MELYIPPADAVQFIFDRFPNDPVWVEAAGWPLEGPRIAGCTCKLGFKIVYSPGFHITCPVPGTSPSVCRCWGNFIE